MLGRLVIHIIEPCWKASILIAVVSIVWSFVIGDIPSGGGHVSPDRIGPRDGHVT